MSVERQKAMSQAREKLMRQIENNREQLRRENAKEGRGWSPKKANQLQREIEGLEKRLATTERLADLPARHAGWLYEDELPDGYDYDANFERSEIRDGVRMFPSP